MKKTWWKEAIMYQIYPRSFKDSNGDGIGDLRGIISKLDHLKELGVDLLWLSPIYQSPNDDNGYDISDYYNIMDEFGTMADFDELLNRVHQRGMRLIMDLVVNHSSDEHAWFEASRQSKDNPYRDYYIWKPPAKDGGPPNNWRAHFGGSAWDYDERTGEYYLHLFSKKQPDLNWENPNVRQEIYRMMRFWMDKGVDGFRMDVMPFISKRQDFPDADFSNFNNAVRDVYANGPRIHEFLQEMYRETCAHYDVMTVGEAPGITPEQANLYVGEDRNELSMIFHFEHMFIDFGPGGRFEPIDIKLSTFKEGFTKWHNALGERGWVNIYLDNHDFPRMVSRFGNDSEYHKESAKLLAMLILSLRGTPCIYQGTEFGMTNVAFENIDDYRDLEIHGHYEEWLDAGGDPTVFLKGVHQNGRDNARTPVQWDASPNAGFTTGIPWIGVNPNYPQINGEAVAADPDSILYFYRRMIAFRKANPTLIYGDYQIIDREHEQVFAYRRFDEERTFWVVLNLTSETVEFPLPIGEPSLRLRVGNYPQEGVEPSRYRPWEARLYEEV